MPGHKGTDSGKPQVPGGVPTIAEASPDLGRKMEGGHPEKPRRAGEEKRKQAGDRQRWPEASGETQHSHGYEEQMSLNTETELVTRVIPGRPNDYGRDSRASWSEWRISPNGFHTVNNIRVSPEVSGTSVDE